MTSPHITRTQVGIVGGGPAGLMLSHLRFAGTNHRIDFADLVGSSVWLYPQTDVFVDLAASRERAGADCRFGVADTRVEGLTSDRPRTWSPTPMAGPSRSTAMSSSEPTGRAPCVATALGVDVAGRRRRAYGSSDRGQGLNLALADVRVLAEVIVDALEHGDRDALDALQPSSTRTGLKGPRLLLLDDEHAAPTARSCRGGEFRRAPAAGRARLGGHLAGRLHPSRRGLHRWPRGREVAWAARGRLPGGNALRSAV